MVSVTRSASSRRPLIGAVLVAAVSLAVVIGIYRSGGHGHRAATVASVHPDSILTGTVARPALTTEGDTVRVALPHGTVLATVNGPVVPGEGLPYQARATTCTWTVTLSHATTDVPLRLADFDSIDHGGVAYHPVFVSGSARAPAVLTPGHTTSFELRAVMVTGEGLMRWAPDGNNIEAKWDFEVEND